MAANNVNYEELNEEEEAAVRFEPFKCLISDLISQNKQLRGDINQLKEHREVHSKKEKELQDEVNQIKKQVQLQYQDPTEQLKDVIDLCRYPFFLLAVTLCIVILGSTYLADPYELCNNRLNEQLNSQAMQNESLQHAIDRLKEQVNSQAMQDESFQHTIDRLIEQSQEQLKEIEVNINRLNEKHEKHGSDMNKLQADDQRRSADILEINKHYMLLERNVQAIRKYMRSLSDTTWKQNGITVAGENGQGNQLNQLYLPSSVSMDDDQIIYVADWGNHRIVEWKYNATEGRIVAGENGQGDQMNQLNGPIDVIIDQETNSLIIADEGNRRVMRWSRHNNANAEVIIADIDCSRLTMDENGSLYVSDGNKGEVRRWRKGEKGKGTIVAGGNGPGDRLNQLNFPTFLFVDDDESVYVSDRDNHRVMKWVKDGREGVVVAGGHGEGDSLRQLSSPQGVVVDQLGQVYVADSYNHRIMRWRQGAAEGTVVVGGNRRGNKSSQLNYPTGLSFDRQGNLYVADWGNGRIQKFEIN